MALFKSQVLSQASGSVGGLTYTRTPSGMVIRARSMPVNPRTARQQDIRNAMSILAGRWSATLTDEQRESWTVYAGNVKVRNKLGDQVSLSGIAMYTRCNTPRLQTGSGPIDSAPTDMTVGDPISNGALTIDTGVPTYEFSYDPVPTASVAIYLSTGQSAGINFFKGPYRLNSGTPSSGLVTLVGDPSWVVGNKVFARARLMYGDGRLSPATEYATTVTNTP